MVDTEVAPLVTVVVPTRNRPELLAKAISSVVEQDVALELILVDEASDVPIVAPTGLPFRCHLVRHEKPVGPAAARNAGVGAGRAPFVAFLDDDDVWLPTKLSSCLEQFERWPDAGMVMHRMRFAGERTSSSGQAILSSDALGRMLHRQPPHVDAVLVRRAVHESVRFDESFPAAADLDYMLRLAIATPFVVLDEVLGEHSPPEGRLTDIALERRIRGREQFKSKHAHLFDRRASAFYWVRMGHLQRRSGRRFRAGRCFVRGLILDATNGLAWRGLAMSALPRLAARLQVRRA